jgi:hypothetical protein
MPSRLGAEGAILYPTAALTVGLVQEAEWAVLVSSAYNSWVEDSYTRRDDRLFAAGIVPLQDPAAAVAELERCARKRRGIKAIVLPSVNKLHKNLGHSSFWPIYEAAERLSMPIAVHGSPSWGFGLDTMDQFVKVHALSHPKDPPKSVVSTIPRTPTSGVRTSSRRCCAATPASLPSRPPGPIAATPPPSTATSSTRGATRPRPPTAE